MAPLCGAPVLDAPRANPTREYKSVASPFTGTVRSQTGCGALHLRHLRSRRHQALISEVAAARQAAGISQRELAAKLKRSASYVSKFEAGERRLEVCEFVDLCAAIGADPLALLGRVLRR